MKTKKIKGNKLAILLGINPNIYMRRPKNGDRTFLNVATAFSKQMIHEIPSEIQPVEDGPFKTGEIWKDRLFQKKYLYLGKLPSRPEEDDFSKDVLLVLGGNTLDAGKISVLHANYEREVFLDEKIFPS